MTEASPNLQTELETYLDLVFGTESGYVYVPVKNKDDAWIQSFFLWPSQRSDLIEYISINGTQRDVYIGPSLFSQPKVSKENVQGSRVVWVEFDGSVPSLASLDGVPRPSLRIRSSDENHEHWYWLLDQFITNVMVLETINRSLCYTLKADAGSWDSTQVLRPPGTFNYKQEIARAVSFQEVNDTPLNISIFKDVSIPPQIVTDEDFGTIPDVFDVVAKYPWPPGLIRFFKSKQEYPKRSAALLSLAYSCAEMGMSNAEIFSVIRNADDRWRKFYGRSDRDRRLSDMVNKARLKYAEPKLSSVLATLPIFGFESFLNTKIEIDWVIDGLLHKAGYLLLTSKSGVGKSQLSLRFAMAMALGKDYLGFKINQPRKLGFFSLEMGHAELKWYIDYMAKGLTSEDLKLLEQNLLLLPIGEPLYLNTPVGKDQFVRTISENNLDGFMFDSIGSGTDEDTSNEKIVKQLMDLNDRVRNEFNCFSWFVHHNRKAQAQNKKPIELDDIYGNQYIANRATSIFTLWPKSKDVIEMLCIKLRLAPRLDPIELIRTSELNFFIKKPSMGMTTLEIQPAKSHFSNLIGGM